MASKRAKKPAKKKPKATQVEKKARVVVVRDMLLEGETRIAIVRFGANSWKLAPRQMDQYIADATAEIDEANKNSTEHHLALITGGLWGLYRRHLAKEPGSARQCLLDIAKLRGLNNEEVILKIKREHRGASEAELAAALEKGDA